MEKEYDKMLNKVDKEWDYVENLKANEEKLGEEALTALRRFEATHRPEFQADRQRQISEANAARQERRWEADAHVDD